MAGGVPLNGALKSKAADLNSNCEAEYLGRKEVGYTDRCNNLQSSGNFFCYDDPTWGNSLGGYCWLWAVKGDCSESTIDKDSTLEHHNSQADPDGCHNFSIGGAHEKTTACGSWPAGGDDYKKGIDCNDDSGEELHVAEGFLAKYTEKRSGEAEVAVVEMKKSGTGFKCRIAFYKQNIWSGFGNGNCSGFLDHPDRPDKHSNDGTSFLKGYTWLDTCKKDNFIAGPDFDKRYTFVFHDVTYEPVYPPSA